MLDIKKIRDNAREIEKKLRSKDPTIDLKEILSIDEQVRSLKTEAELLRSHLKKTSKKIGEKKRLGQDDSTITSKVIEIKESLSKLNLELKTSEEKLEKRLLYLPNIPDHDVKISLDPKENVCIKTFSKAPSFSFSPKNHLELNEKLGIFDFVRGAKLTGTGWPIYRDMGARLEWALLNYMIDIHLKNGFTFCLVPHLVKEEAMYASAQLPKFQGQFYKLDDPDYPFTLIPTGEVSLNGMHLDEIFSKDELPKKYITYTPCFRRESGAAGAGERGLIRVHQFNKVEMFAFTEPEKSDEMFESMIQSAEEVLKGLNLHFRNMLLVTGDMAFAASRTVDIEVFLPGQDRYYEVSSVSNCRDFQARRSKIRYRLGQKKPELVHTLNGSGVATARLMVALLENNQNEDGSITLPEVLRPYLGGLDRLN
ncbi:MAG: serine--tRNA ligase [Simkaniaceae bacterium]